MILPLLMAVAASAAGPRHILFAFVDHFEPRGSSLDPGVTAWVDDYIAMAGRHADADGRHPIHSYFLLFGSGQINGITVPVIDPNCLDKTLIKLNEATYAGYGEVELHCHHGLIDESKRTEKEATNELVDLLVQAKQRFNRYGALLTAEPVPKCTFGFIHGMWALDNSRLFPWPSLDPVGRQYCGVNRELALLRDQGAYADFTFPAGGSMDPFMLSTVFYASDDTLPASYERLANTRLVAVREPPWGDLMIVEGPGYTFNARIDSLWRPTLSRMNDWVARDDVHVFGNDDWVVIKVHTHGLANDTTAPAVWDTFFGPTMDQFYTDIERSYNDGVNWKLHYVSAREMYNIIRAAQAGMTGDPGLYRDFLIPRYAIMQILMPHPYRLVTYSKKAVTLELLETPTTFRASFKQFPVGASVLESQNETGPWALSDARRDQGRFGELRLSDVTPSRYYTVRP